MELFHSNFMLQQTLHEDDQNQPPTSLASLISSGNPHELHGVTSTLSKGSSMSLSTGTDVCKVHMNNINHGGEHELSDGNGSQMGAKKKRLNREQMKTLEKNFDLGNKVEPERRMELAAALGLEPRQIAIWFQNRRARCKTKQLEKDYDLLKKQFEALRDENDALRAQNQKLHAEILALKSREQTESINLNKETEGSCSNRSENNSEIKLDISISNPAIDSPIFLKNPIIIANKSLFPSSFSRPAQLFQDSSRPEFQGLKMDKEESLCNMFCAVDDQTGFWPWLEQQNFN